jgi:hypothetical protein
LTGTYWHSILEPYVIQHAWRVWVLGYARIDVALPLAISAALTQPTGRRFVGEFPMRLVLLILIALTSPAHSTVDQWFVLRYPLAALQVENANCEAMTIALDAHSSGPQSTATALAGVLSRPIEVLSPLSRPVARVDSNAITESAKAPVGITFDVVDPDPVIAANLDIDVTSLAAKNGTGCEGRADTVKRAKLALVYVLKNFVASHPKSKVTVTIKGMPNQDGLPGTRLLASTQWPYTEASDVYRTLLIELAPAQDCPK